MDDLSVWLAEKWPQFLAALSIGGGSGFLTKKYKDKKQDRQIGELKERVGKLERFRVNHESEMKLNRLEDMNTKDTVLKLVETVNSNKREMDVNFTSITKIITDGQLAQQQQLTELMLKITK